MCNYKNGTTTIGSYFVYKGVKYGRGTQLLLTEEFYKKRNIIKQYSDYSYNTRRYFKVFNTIENVDGKETWMFGQYVINYFDRYTDIDPDRDIVKIITPVWYYTPRELVRKRFEDGTWFSYIWQQTLFYFACLLISPLFQEWYILWTIGLYIYLRLCYIELARGELNYEW